jgi:hypothetical protein
VSIPDACVIPANKESNLPTMLQQRCSSNNTSAALGFRLRGNDGHSFFEISGMRVMQSTRAGVVANVRGRQVRGKQYGSPRAPESSRKNIIKIFNNCM